MKRFYLVGAILVFLLILILAMPQVGTTCVWYLIGTTTNPTLVLFQASGLGGVLGGLLVLYWKEPKPRPPGEDEEGGGDA